MGLLHVQVHPRARRDALRGFRADGALKLDVIAAPEDGRANQAVADLLAEALGVGRSAVSVVRGRASRAKLIEVDGLSDADLKARLERHAARGESGASKGKRP